MKNFEKAYKRLREAQVSLNETVIKSFPKGINVFYMHGYYERTGCVIDHNHDRVKIMSPNGKEFWIDAYRIKRISA
jgi:hypothetical protein